MNIASFKVTRNATILFLDFSAVGVLNYAFWLVLARIATLEANGIVSTIFSIIIIFTSIISPGIPRATSKYVSELLTRRNTNSVRAIIKSAIMLVFALSIIAAALLILLAVKISDIYEYSGFITPLRISALLVVLFPLSSVISGVYQGFQKMEYCFAQDLLLTGSKFFLGLGLVTLGFDIIGPVLGVIIGGFSVIFLAFFFISRLLRRIQDIQPHQSKNDPEGDLVEWTDLIQLGVPNSVINGMIRFPSRAGTLILGLFGGSLASVAWYYLSLQTILSITMISSALEMALLPAVSDVWVDKHISELRSALNTCLRYFFVIIVPIVMIAFYFPEKILLIFGKDYLPAVPMLKILLLAIPAIGILQIFVSVLTGIGSTKWLTRLSLILLFVYFFLAVGLTKIYGLIGTSGAFTCSIAIGALVIFWMTQKATKIPIELLTLAKTIFPSTIYLILTIILTSLSVNFLIALFLGFVIYMPLSFLFGTLIRQDIVFIKNVLRIMTGNQNEKS